MIKYKTKAQLIYALSEQIEGYKAACKFVEEAPPQAALLAAMQRDQAYESLRHWIEVNSILLTVLPDE